MASDLDRKREELKKLYPKSTGWRKRVNQMSPEQVTAIYLKFLSERKLRK